jgi:hypothetical protein
LGALNEELVARFVETLKHEFHLGEFGFDCIEINRLVVSLIIARLGVRVCGVTHR